MNEWEWQLLEDKAPLKTVEIQGVAVRAGDRVRLRPRQAGDVLDLALAGQTATIEAIEQDYEGKAHVSVVLDDDPGRDMGMLRQPGHRFFFDVTEVEPLACAGAQREVERRKVLVAGIGNIFLGDDAFGVETARRLLGRELPSGVRVTDFGIRGFDLAYALEDGYETVILVDACPRGQPPGTVYVVEPDLEALSEESGETVVDGHGMNPVRVLKLARSLGVRPKRILLVGCEPEYLGGQEGHMGLSAAVESAVGEAVTKIEWLVNQILNGKWPGSSE